MAEMRHFALLWRLMVLLLRGVGTMPVDPSRVAVVFYWWMTSPLPSCPVVGRLSINTLLKKSNTTWTTRRQPRLPIDAIATGHRGQALLISGTTITQVNI